MLNENELNEVVNKEITKIETEAHTKIQLVEYAKIIFNQKYDQIKEVYKDDSDKNDDKKLFLRTRFNIEQVIDLTKPHCTLHMDTNVDPTNLGMLSKWVYWAGSDMPGNGYTAIINEQGKEIINGWNKYKNSNL